MRILYSVLLLSISSLIVKAQTSENSFQTPDTTATKKLKEVIVEVELQKTDALERAMKLIKKKSK